MGSTTNIHQQEHYGDIRSIARVYSIGFTPPQLQLTNNQQFTITVHIPVGNMYPFVMPYRDRASKPVLPENQ